MNSFGLGNRVYKILREVNKKGKLIFESATGFCINIPSQEYKFFVTNNHILDEDFVYHEKKLIIYKSNNDKIEIDLDINRFKMTNKELDFTLIEILPEDNITDFLEIDEFINSKNYIDEDIITLHFPEGKNLESLEGKNVKMKKEYLEYSFPDSPTTSGAPIILKYNLKVIGLFKENYKKKKKTFFDYAVPFNLILNKLNFMKCVYNVKEIGEKVQIINNGFTDEDNFYKHNNEIENKIDILIDGGLRANTFSYKFSKEGKHNVYIIQKKGLSDMSHLFNQCKDLEEVNFSFFRTADVTDMRNLFCECTSLKKINFSIFNTENVINMSNMFIGCSSLKELNLSKFQTNNTTNMSNMFSGCSALREINLSSFNTRNVTDMSCMFAFCSSLRNIDLSNFDTKKVTRMNDMFRYCQYASTINLSSFDAGKVKHMEDIFFGVPASCKIICDDEKIIALVPKLECFGLGCSII